LRLAEPTSIRAGSGQRSSTGYGSRPPTTILVQKYRKVKRVDFAIRMPSAVESGHILRARISYLYRDTVVRSQRLDIGPDGRQTVDTDFSLSAHLADDLDVIASRPRITIFTNQASDGRHHVTVRGAGGAGFPDAVSFALSGASVRAVASARDGLEDISPVSRRRRRHELIEDLRRLAPLGRILYLTLPPTVQSVVREGAAKHPDLALQVVIPDDTLFTIPWSLVYAIHLPDATPVEELDICPVVAEWDEEAPMVSASVRGCPCASEADHAEGLLCPFGFWGYRYPIEVLTSTDRPKTGIQCAPGTSVVIAKTERDVDADRMSEHVSALTKAFSSIAPGLAVRETTSATALRTMIEDDLPVVYLLCHGESHQGMTRLGLGHGEELSLGELVGWVDAAAERGRRMWTDPQPFVFINACGSLALRPDDLVNYIGAFIGRGHAVGVVGSEASVEQRQAMDLAEIFFATLLQSHATVEDAMRQVRLAFLADGNLLGLMYTAYGFADLAVELS
jgi:hypothetical protein